MILDKLTSPDRLGASEYRAIYDTLQEAIASLDDDIRDSADEQIQLALAVLVEFELYARSIRQDLLHD